MIQLLNLPACRAVAVMPAAAWKQTAAGLRETLLCYPVAGGVNWGWVQESAYNEGIKAMPEK
jgi:hypothetical protein